MPEGMRVTARLLSYRHMLLFSTCECILSVDTVAIVRFIETTACAIPFDVYRRFGSLGGDPAADSPTATLLRLNPPHGT